MASPVKVCRFCLGVISNSFEVLNFQKVEMLKTISLDLDLTLTDDPLVCCKCLDILQLSFDFKTTCLKNEVYLKTFLQSDGNDKLILEVVVQRNVIENGIKCEKEDVCRFCLKNLDSTSFLNLDNINEDMFLRDILHKCLPEIQLNITYRPLMCYDCMEKLQKQCNFITVCLDNDQKIKNYAMTSHGHGKGRVDLNNVLTFRDNINSDNKVAERDLNYVKVENDSENINNTSCNSVMKKEELDQSENSEINIKTEENIFSETGNEIESNSESANGESEVAIKKHQCGYCSYTSHLKYLLNYHIKTNHEFNITHRRKCLLGCEKCWKKFSKKLLLDSHYLNHHGELSHLIESKVYRCEVCNYRTVYLTHLTRHEKIHHLRSTKMDRRYQQFSHKVV